LALDFLHHGIRTELLDRDTEVIEPRRLVLEEREKVLSQAQEAVRLCLADDGQVKLRNVPGALGNFAGKLASSEINITSGYATVVKGAKKASVVLAVSDLDKAARVRHGRAVLWCRA
jgi:hypothetical protein